MLVNGYIIQATAGILDKISGYEKKNTPGI